MSTTHPPEYEYLWLNPGGTWVSALKAYEDAPLFRIYPNGDRIPDCYFD